MADNTVDFVEHGAQVDCAQDCSAGAISNPANAALQLGAMLALECGCRWVSVDKAVVHYRWAVYGGKDYGNAARLAYVARGWLMGYVDGQRAITQEID